MMDGKNQSTPNFCCNNMHQSELVKSSIQSSYYNFAKSQVLVKTRKFHIPIHVNTALVGSRAAGGQGNSWTWAEAEQRKASGDEFDHFRWFVGGMNHLKYDFISMVNNG